VTRYHVSWRVEVEADGPVEAAHKARALQRRASTRGDGSRVFNVTPEGAPVTTVVNLDDAPHPVTCSCRKCCHARIMAPKVRS
jgi:hypothetical protein